MREEDATGCGGVGSGTYDVRVGKMENLDVLLFMSKRPETLTSLSKGTKPCLEPDA